MVLKIFKSIVVGTAIATVHITTHLLFGDIDTFAEAGVYAAGIAVFLSSTIASYLLFD